MSINTFNQYFLHLPGRFIGFYYDITEYEQILKNYEIIKANIKVF